VVVEPACMFEYRRICICIQMLTFKFLMVSLVHLMLKRLLVSVNIYIFACYLFIFFKTNQKEIKHQNEYIF